MMYICKDNDMAEFLFHLNCSTFANHISREVETNIFSKLFFMPGHKRHLFQSNKKYLVNVVSWENNSYSAKWQFWVIQKISSIAGSGSGEEQELRLPLVCKKKSMATKGSLTDFMFVGLLPLQRIFWTATDGI